MVEDSPKARILAAAHLEFAEHGPRGGRVDQIAAAAGVNKRMLYHYCGDKAALFDACVAACRARLRQAAGSDPEAVLGALQRADWRLLVWSGGLEAADLETLVAACAAARKAGTLRAAAPDAAVALCLLGTHLVEQLFGGSPAASAADVRDLLSAAPTPPGPRPRLRLRPTIAPGPAR